MNLLIFSLVMLTITTGMFFRYFGDVSWMNIAFNDYEYHFIYSWIDTLGIHWAVGLDALSFPMVWLTTFLLPVTIIATWNEKHGATYFPLLLMMGGALIGVFVSLDLFMFYVFWELTLIPMFFLILKWGGKDRRYAAQKFFIYTFTASVIMLLGLITLYFLQDPYTLNYSGSMTGRSFSIPELIDSAKAGNLGDNWYLGAQMQKILFVMLMIGFLVKLPVVPFHTWLPDAHVQAPTGGSMLLAGVMLKMGAYGMFRLPISLFPCPLPFPTSVDDYRNGFACLGCNSLSWSNQSQENGCLFVSFSHGCNLNWNRHNAANGLGCCVVHDVCTRNN